MPEGVPCCLPRPLARPICAGLQVLIRLKVSWLRGNARGRVDASLDPSTRLATRVASIKIPLPALADARLWCYHSLPALGLFMVVVRRYVRR